MARELENEDLNGRGKVLEIDELLQHIISLYESNSELFDSYDEDRHLQTALKYYESEKNRMSVEISGAIDVLKKAVTLEGIMALQALAGTREWDMKSHGAHYHYGAEERFNQLIEKAEGTWSAYNRIKREMENGCTKFSFEEANEAFKALRRIIDSKRLFPMDELLAEENEIVYADANKKDTIFPKQLSEAICEVCNGIIFKKVSDNAFIYAINHPHHPYPLTKLKDQNNRIFFMIYALSRCLRQEEGRLWVARMLDVLDLKKSSYDSKATYCIGANASPDDRKFVDSITEAFENAEMTPTW